jgi:hypothetical protein
MAAAGGLWGFWKATNLDRPKVAGDRGRAMELLDPDRVLKTLARDGRRAGASPSTSCVTTFAGGGFASANSVDNSLLSKQRKSLRE